MANQWFRMYHEFATDPKVQMLSEKDQRRFVMILCLRCCNDDVTLHDEEVAFQLRISNDEWSESKQLLLSKGLIDEYNKPTAWDRRQYASDSSRERVARHRARKKKECNVTVTPPDTDTDTDTDTDINTCAKAQKDLITERFDRFWEAYPKKRNKGAAEKVWGRIKPNEQLMEQIIAGIERAKKSVDWIKDNGQYIPYPSTWLNAKGWEDEVTPPTQFPQQKFQGDYSPAMRRVI